EHDHDSNETSNDDDDHDDMDEFMEMMFTMLDTNEDGSLNESELHAMMDMGEDEHEEGVAFIGFHVEEEGDYGIALPAGVNMHVLMRGGHDGHDHGDHDDHDDHGDEDGGDDHDDHGDEDGDDHDGHADEEIAFDPHSWLDPVAFAAQVEIVYDTLSAAFPEGADTFRANADAYKAELMAIDEGFTAAFGDGGTCTTNVVAANHNAYAYIAQRYDIDFVTLHGIDPEGEPSPDAIAEVLERVDEDGIKAIYVEEYSAEGALDSLIAQTVSDDLPNGLAVLTLNTMEMAPTDSTEDYLSLMNENLENLKTGLGC
ncbi:MAG TPA: zinc ABC transporter substrate-binding protein, partial [Candidatus Poseidoniales archaeon]